MAATLCASGPRLVTRMFLNTPLFAGLQSAVLPGGPQRGRRAIHRLRGETQMRRRGLLAVPALLASMALGAPAAQADDALKMYRVTVDDRGVGKLAELGVDIGHTGYDHTKKIAQTIFVDLIDAQAREARADGLGLTEVTPGPHVTETEISKRIASAKGKSRAAAKPETGGDSPNPFYDVYRTYSEPGGI